MRTTIDIGLKGMTPTVGLLQDCRLQNNCTANVARRSIFFPLLVLVAIIFAARCPDAFTNPQFWAEDGTVFFKQQFGQALPMLHLPYAGYFHSIYRMVAWIASLGPIEKAPTLYTLGWLFISASAVAYTADRLRKWIPPLIVVAPFFLTPTSGEVFGTLTNAQWYIQFALAAACLLPPSRTDRMREFFACALVFLMATQGPFSPIVLLVMLPFLLLKVLSRKIERFQDSPATAFASGFPKHRLLMLTAGAIIQLWQLTHEPTRPLITFGPLKDLIFYAFGDSLQVHLFGEAILSPKMWIAYLIVLVVLVLRGRRLSGQGKILLLTIVALASIQISLACAQAPEPMLVPFGAGDRFFLQAKVVFWWLLYIALSGFRGLRTNETQMLILAGLMFICMKNPDKLQRIPLSNLHWAETSRKILEPGHHSIQINPLSWKIEVDTVSKEQ